MNRRCSVCFALLALILSCMSLSGRTRDEKAAAALARRIVPSYAQRIRFIQTDGAEEGYELFSEGRTVVIRADGALSMAVGLNRYLEDYCLTTVSWYATDPVEVPAAMRPSPSSASTHTVSWPS